MPSAPTPNQRPHVVAHVATSLEGATTGFAPNLSVFYQLASTFQEDVTLVGADTLLAVEPDLATAPSNPSPDGPLLAVVDGKARITQWDALRNVGHWSDVLALHCRTTPPRPPDRGTRELVIGNDRVDLAGAINALGRQANTRVIRVDSGGALIGALLKDDLLDEISLLVHPCLTGAGDVRFWYGTETRNAAELELTASESLEGGLVWLRYRPRRS